MSTTLRLPRGYRSRRANHKPSTPTSHQTSVYRTACGLAHTMWEVKCIIDLGCSTGNKVRPFWDHQVEGYDLRPPKFGPYTSYRSVDLECCRHLPIFSSKELIICADVIEHLNSPRNLLRSLSRSVHNGSTLVISTPDREKIPGTPLGPPRNPNHTREWTLREFWGLLTDFQIPVLSAGHTMNHEEKGGVISTSILVCHHSGN